MKVLVTGGAGFIGSHLAERLLGRGDEVCALDDLSTGRVANVEPLLGRAGFSLRTGSACDAALVEEAAAGADAIVHLAAAVGVRLVVERPVHAIETNVRATEVVLAAAARSSRRPRVLLASTSEVYGRNAGVPFREEDDLSFGATTRARGSYACSKALDEWLAFAVRRERGVPVVVARIFNTVGPRQVGRYGMVLPNFARQAAGGEPITVFGDGLQTRCFADVRDTVEALTRLLDLPAADGEVFNVGGTREISILDLARLVRERARSASEIVLVPYERAYDDPGFEDMRRRVPDVSKLERATGFRCRIPLETTVDDVLADADADANRPRSSASGGRTSG